MSSVSGHVFRYAGKRRPVYVPRPQDAALVGKAFEPSPSPPAPDFEDSGQGRLL